MRESDSLSPSFVGAISRQWHDNVILVIDNYDSFVHNLARYFQQLGHHTHVVRNDQITASEAHRLRPDAIVLSPGPCTPNEAGGTLEMVRHVAGEIPLLGVCLGHQTIAAAWGAQIVRATTPMHGRTSVIEHDGTGLFAGLPQPLTVCRYHSLVVQESSLPPCLKATARAADGTLMALEHREAPVFGVQFHPESILTEAGFPLLANFLQLCGLSVSARLPTMDEERPPLPSAVVLPTTPVTF